MNSVELMFGPYLGGDRLKFPFILCCVRSLFVWHYPLIQSRCFVFHPVFDNIFRTHASLHNELTQRMSVCIYIGLLFICRAFQMMAIIFHNVYLR